MKVECGLGSFLDECMNKVIRILQSEQLENTPHVLAFVLALLRMRQARKGYL